MLVKPSRMASAPDTAAPEIPSITSLVNDLRNGQTPAIRRHAAQILRTCPDAAHLLCAQLTLEPDASVRAAILTTLIRLKSPQVIGALVDNLRSDSAALRNEVIEALQDMPEEAMPVVEDLLDDPDSDVRIFAANILSGLPHHHAPAVLTRMILEDPHVNVCMAALDGLLEVGDQTTLDAVQQLGFRFPDAPYVQFAVSMAIKRLRG